MGENRTSVSASGVTGGIVFDPGYPLVRPPVRTGTFPGGGKPLQTFDATSVCWTNVTAGFNESMDTAAPNRGLVLAGVSPALHGTVRVTDGALEVTAPGAQLPSRSDRRLRVS